MLGMHRNIGVIETFLQSAKIFFFESKENCNVGIERLI
jgi:hypothetical protein